MPHINDRYKLIQDKIEHKLREIATHQIIDINYEINTEWAIVNVFRHLIIQFDKSEFRDLALDTCLN